MVGSHHWCIAIPLVVLPWKPWYTTLPLVVLPWKPLMYHTTTGGPTCCLVSFASCTALACSSSSRILVATATVCMEEERERERGRWRVYRWRNMEEWGFKTHTSKASPTGEPEHHLAAPLSNYWTAVTECQMTDLFINPQATRPQSISGGENSQDFIEICAWIIFQ